MQGASPLASPRLNPGGIGAGGESCTRRRACVPCRLSLLPLVCFLSPIPLTPFPTGEGGRGDRGQESKPKAGWAGDKKGKPPQGTANARRAGNAGGTPPPGTTTAGRASAANGLMQGCRGRSPRRNKLIVSPFPAGEGGRGDRGQESKPKAGWAGEEKGKPPLWSQETTPHPPCHTAKKRQKKSPEPRIRADSGQSQSYSGKVPGARGTLSGVPRRFSFLSTDPKPCHQGDPGWSRRRGTLRRGVQAPARGGG